MFNEFMDKREQEIIELRKSMQKTRDYLIDYIDCSLADKQCANCRLFTFFNDRRARSCLRKLEDSFNETLTLIKREHYENTKWDKD